jgi:hypothetical protein
MTATIAALIPTRNRADLAIAAVRSLLDQDCPIEIFVSDNSTSADGLRDFCLSEKHVHYLRPSTELSMPEHWDWALSQVLERSQATHITLHYDRKVSKPREWGALRSIASRRPDSLITFTADFVTVDPPRRLWQPPWTGKLYSVTTARTAALVAAARINHMGQALPILSNCLIPRTILIRMAQRFGDICNGTSGDAPFLCRYLTLDERYLHYDRPIGIGYAPQRSAGFGYLRGEGGDFPDYQKIWGERKWLERAPIPGINLGHNMLFHEYEIVREQTGERLPPIDFDAYLHALGEALRLKTDAAERERLKQILVSHGWSDEDNPAPSLSAVTKIRHFAGDVLRRLRFGSERRSGFSFRDDEEAIRFALAHPLTATQHSVHLDTIEAEEVAA